MGKPFSCELLRLCYEVAGLHVDIGKQIFEVYGSETPGVVLCYMGLDDGDTPSNPKEKAKESPDLIENPIVLASNRTAGEIELDTPPSRARRHLRHVSKTWRTRARPKYPH